ncbi:response regulator [Hyphomicrobium sp. MC1]|uniref:response regulator n=1 Tax=Hyphomicrobium sp. (strain MC1) TaxID=717785 RepID=UPI000213EAE4|nr:response regulator [Hyphomicrobium sp. MC1]CCB64091.1 putative hybrid histidine kinase [Hyphomicrobium sp. MC1]
MPPKVLYIDDDPGIGRLVQKTLQANGFDVELAYSGDDGLNLVRAKPYDIVALDHHMPGMVGLQVLKEIRALPNPPPVVYVTGSEDSRVAVAALKAGAIDYVWKDVQGHFRELLMQAVQTSLEQERLRRDMEAAETEIRLARDRAELLLKEVNHRVANSLAIVAGLLALQRHSLSDPGAQDLLDQMSARIIAIAGVHRRLYTSQDVTSVDLKEYLTSLIEDLKRAMGDAGHNHPVHLNCVPLSIPTDKAVSVGIVVTELVTNAYKYAYPDRADGEIRVDVTLREGQVVLTVEDDGVGLDKTQMAGGTRLGTRVMTSMTSSIGGKLAFSGGDSGTRAMLTFPV